MKYGGFPINCPLNQSIESPQVFTGMCHCYHFVCYFCFADVFACICLKPEAYTIAINCTHNDLSISLYMYIYLYTYPSSNPPDEADCYYCLLARWLVDLIVCGIDYSMLELCLFHLFCATLPWNFTCCYLPSLIYLMLIDWWCCFNYMQVILSIFNDKGILSLILWHTWILLQSHLYDLAKSNR